MSLDAREKSTYRGAPFEAYWFSCGPQSWRITSGDTPRTIGGFTYEPGPVLRGEIEQCAELRSGQMTVSLPLDHEISQLFRAYLPPQPVSLVIFRGDDNESEVGTAFIGQVASPKSTETCDLTLVPEQDALKKGIPGLKYQYQCPRQLFSAGCTLRKADWGIQSTLIQVSGVTLRSSAFASRPNGWFNGGWIETDTTAMAILSHAGDTVTLSDPLAGLEVGDVVMAYPGCEGTEACCRDRFGNLVNHLGFARIPLKNPFSAGGIA